MAEVEGAFRISSNAHRSQLSVQSMEIDNRFSQLAYLMRKFVSFGMPSFHVACTSCVQREYIEKVMERVYRRIK
jgi:hypothetical protein